MVPQLITDPALTMDQEAIAVPEVTMVPVHIMDLHVTAAPAAEPAVPVSMAVLWATVWD